MAIGRAQIGAGAMSTLALEARDRIIEQLNAIHRELRWLREQEQGKRHYQLQFGGAVEAGKTLEIRAPEPIAQGYTFIPERIMAQAPKGCKLQVFENSTSINNFLEVVTNIQEYANVCAGLIIEGPSQLICVVLGAEATGPVSITLSGQLVKAIPSTDRAVA